MTPVFSKIAIRLGDSALGIGREATGLAGLFYDTIIAVLVPGYRGYRSVRKQIISQILYTGVEALPLVAVIALLCGVIIVVQAITSMPRIGIGEYFGNILNAAIIRELAPFFTAFVVIGRSGAALASYIANMRVAREIAAIEVMGINPVHFIVVPAFFGIVISMACLNVYFSVIAIGGGVIVAHFAGVTANIPFWIFIGRIMHALTLQDIFVLLAKGVVFGCIVAIVSCYYGFSANNVREVPQVSIKSVVVSMSVMVLVNIFVAIKFYA